jgi:hypothetical protein
MSLAAAPNAPPLSWRAIVVWLLVLHAALSALVARQPSDLFWLSTPIAQIGIFAALALSVMIPTLSFFRRFWPRLAVLGAGQPIKAVVACLGLGLVSRIGGDFGRLAGGASPYNSWIDFVFAFPANVLCTALVFLLTARIMVHQSARSAPPANAAPASPVTERPPHG